MKTEYQQQVINRIKYLREERGLTQLAISRLLDISPGQMGNIDSNRRSHKYTLKQIVTICDSLSAPIEYVFFGNKDGEGVRSARDIIDAIIKYQNGF